jgi:hypothetical protein
MEKLRTLSIIRQRTGLFIAPLVVVLSLLVVKEAKWSLLSFR